MKDNRIMTKVFLNRSNYDDQSKVQNRVVNVVSHQNKQDQVEFILEETPVALVYNGITHVVMMVTGANLIEFAMGFSLSEGIIEHANALYFIDVKKFREGFSIEMEISSRDFTKLKHLRKTMMGNSGCGLCGIESLNIFQQQIPVINTPLNPQWMEEIEQVVLDLKRYQPLGELTGASHVAAWVEHGKILQSFEDIGRHNALDKLLGYIAYEQKDVKDGFVFMSSRASYELIRKCAQFNIAMLATISAPSTLAIDQAKQAGIRLLSFCREQRYTIYA